MKSTAMKHSKLLSCIAAVALAVSTPSLFATDFTVTMQDFTFTPNAISIGVGDSITWTNVVGFHTSTSGSPPGTSDGLWDSGGFSAPGSYTLTFTNAKTYPYYC